MRRTLIIDLSMAGMRLDAALANVLEDISRSRLKALIDGGAVLVNGKPKKASCAVCGGDLIEVDIPDPVPDEVIPQKMDLEIVYEDDQLIVVNKPKGLSVHPGAGHADGTLVNGLLYHCRDLSGIGGVLRPGIVHRIDKDTSGILVVCKTDLAHRCIAAQLAEHSITRIYKGIASGNPDPAQGIVDAPIGRHRTDRKKMAVVSDGKRAVTHYETEEYFDGAALMRFRLETGRTHQIRVHMASIGHPLLFDSVYGRRGGVERELIAKRPSLKDTGQLLHAMTLGFLHPVSGEYMEFSAPLPEEFISVLQFLRK